MKALDGGPAGEWCGRGPCRLQFHDGSPGTGLAAQGTRQGLPVAACASPAQSLRRPLQPAGLPQPVPAAVRRCQSPPSGCAALAASVRAVNRQGPAHIGSHPNRERGQRPGKYEVVAACFAGPLVSRALAVVLPVSRRRPSARCSAS